ncbi:PQQ-binding-like beta-propeller repeat protein [Streptomyces sp. SPB162]|uniref:PQQ-binding-like beta-propeller repeat protein n=1 Tax=Streptomyces sp. SPB162 TaxID=2940560 RepID=UPI00240503DD|nr:PQQ-binding-like beta-propeller repeat protein [Streptomyces sp. SPB162]MDF9815603.1 outer membrane protein assembly factor BamB [Streptomyces sp. SPB162]
MRFAQDALLASDGGALYLTASQGSPLDDDYTTLLLAYDLKDRRERWRATAGHSPSEAPAAALAGDRLLYCDGEALTSLDRRTGEQQWTRALPGSANGRPAVAGPRAYVAGGGVTAVALDDGAVAWRHSTRDRTYSDPVIADGVLYAAGPAAGVLALDARTGNPLWGERPRDTAGHPVRTGGARRSPARPHRRRPAVRRGVRRPHPQGGVELPGPRRGNRKRKRNRRGHTARHPG